MSDPDPEDWSCPHGGRWIRWPGGWMQVVAPMTYFEEPGIAQPACTCVPPYPGEKQPVPEVRAVPDEFESDEDLPGEDSWDPDDIDEEEF